MAKFFYVYQINTFIGLLNVKRKDKKIRSRLSSEKRGNWYLTCINTLRGKQTALFIRELKVWPSVSTEQSRCIQVHSLAKPRFVVVSLCSFTRFHWRFLQDFLPTMTHAMQLHSLLISASNIGEWSACSLGRCYLRGNASSTDWMQGKFTWWSCLHYF